MSTWADRGGVVVDEYDAILIPGGGVREAGELPVWVQRRLDRAVELYSGQYLITLSAGTVHRPPPLDRDGFPIPESIAAGKYLIEHGIPPHRVLPEACSYDTIGNAYFSRVVHTEPQGLRRLLIVTSSFHMPRTEAIFRWVYGLPPNHYDLEFERVPDEGIELEDLSARKEREAQSLEKLNALIPRISTVSQLHQWLFTEHQAYAVLGSREGAGETENTY